MPIPTIPRLARAAPRNYEFGSLLETFLITAVTTVLVIRTQLWLTHYPQLGGDGLHIAHLLYGGIFMVLSIGILLTYLGRSPRRPSALIAGVGFGFFIDELGKFITSDNNYFFKPAAALIYLIFIGLFLLINALERQRELSPQECVANAVDIIVDGTHDRLDEHQHRRALSLLERADASDPLVAALRNLLDQLVVVQARPDRFYTRWTRDLGRWYRRVVQSHAFRPVVTTFFALWAFGGLLAVLNLVFSLGGDFGGARAEFVSDAIGDVTFINWATVAGTAVSSGFIVVGLLHLRRNRLEAYRMFERALLVSILVTHVFLFVESQFGAVFGAVLNIILLVAVRSMMRVEQDTEDVTVEEEQAMVAENVMVG